MLKLPQDFINKYQKLLGNEASAFFESLNKDVQKGFRLNPLKNDYKNVALSLTHPIPFIKNGYYGTIKGNTLDHQAGYIYSQDISAMYVGEVINAHPGEKVLDLCAAPGGKSTHIAAQLQNKGLLVSNEINHKRAEILTENLERFGARNVVILNEDPHMIAKNLPLFFDKVVVDAPCSGEGMFRKDHEAVKYWHKDYPHECAFRQQKILADAMKCLKSDGELIYSTCTFAPEEDEKVVEWLLSNYPSLELVDIPKYEGMDIGRPDFANGDPNLKKTVRLMPHHFKGEGQFIAKFKNNVSVVPVRKNKKVKLKKGNFNLNAAEFKLWQKFITDISPQFAQIGPSDFKVFNDHLYLYLQEWPNIFKMKFMRPGIYLGEFKKKRFEPSYALALLLDPTKVKKKLNFLHEQWQQYLTGAMVNIQTKQPNGWYLLVCDNKGFSFGKLVNQTVKNFIPKNIRMH